MIQNSYIEDCGSQSCAKCTNMITTILNNAVDNITHPYAHMSNITHEELLQQINRVPHQFEQLQNKPFENPYNQNEFTERLKQSYLNEAKPMQSTTQTEKESPKDISEDLKTEDQSQITFADTTAPSIHEPEETPQTPNDYQAITLVGGTSLTTPQTNVEPVVIPLSANQPQAIDQTNEKHKRQRSKSRSRSKSQKRRSQEGKSRETHKHHPNESKMMSPEPEKEENTKIEKSYIIVRYKDSLIFSVIGNGFRVEELILPEKFVRVRIEYLPLLQSRIQSLIDLTNNILDNHALINRKKLARVNTINNLSRAKQRFTVNIAKQFCEIQFISVDDAQAFYHELSNLINAISKNDLYDRMVSQLQRSIQVKIESENSHYVQVNNRNHKNMIEAQWSSLESMRTGKIVFRDVADANQTIVNLAKKKELNVRMIERYDENEKQELFFLEIENLPLQFDEMDLERQVYNLNSGYINSYIQRESCSRNFKDIQKLEDEQREAFKQKLTSTFPKIEFTFNSKKQDPNEENKEELYFQLFRGRCTARFNMNSAMQAKAITNELNGINFGKQKLRMITQLELTIPVIGQVFLMFYDEIMKLLEQNPAIKVKIPEKSDIMFQLKPVSIHLVQTTYGTEKQLKDLYHQIMQILRPRNIKIDCDPYSLEQIAFKVQHKFNNLQKQYDCICSQTSKQHSVFKVWFQDPNTYFEAFKIDLQDIFNAYILQKLNLSKKKYNLQKLKTFLDNLQNQNLIYKYDMSQEKTSVTVQLVRSKLQQFWYKINQNPSLLRSQEEKTECEICMEQDYIQQLPCQCYFCGYCLYKYLITEAQTKHSSKKITCPNHNKSPFQIDFLKQFLEHSIIDTIITQRINGYIDSKLSSAGVPKYIRCPNVHCKQAFERFSGDLNQVQNVKQNFGTGSTTFPFFKKCEDCFQEYCLASSGDFSLSYEQQIHLVHPNLTCKEYFKEQTEEYTNLKGLFIINCPSCKTPVTKGEGCNHMTCKCGAHYCAKCLKQFQTSQEVYKHLMDNHQGYFN